MIDRQQRLWIGAPLALVVLALFTVLVFTPLAVWFAQLWPVDRAALDGLRVLLLESSLPESGLRTLAVALLACALASVPAIPAAILAVRAGRGLRVLLPLLAILPLVTPAFVTAGVVRHLGETLLPAQVSAWTGPLPGPGNTIALILVHALHYFPVILFSLIVGLQRIDRAQFDSAYNLGASHLAVWRRVTLPQLAPAYVLAAALVILRVFEDVGAALLLGVDDLLAPQLVLQLQATGAGDPLLTLGALLLFGCSALVTAFAWSALTPAPDHRIEQRCTAPRRWSGGPGAALLAGLFALPLAALSLLLPLGLLLMALAGIGSGQSWPATFDLAALRDTVGGGLPGLANTLPYAAATGVLLLVAGSAVGWLSTVPGLLHRVARVTTNWLFAIPLPVLALAYHDAAELAPPLPAAWLAPGGLALILVVTWKHLPFARYLLARQLRLIGHAGQESLRNLGLPRSQLYPRLLWPALGGAMVAVFLIGLLAAAVELTAVMILLDDAAPPLSLSLYHAFQNPPQGAAAAAQATVLILATGIGLVLVYRWGLARRCPQLPSTPPARPSPKKAI